MNRLFYIIGLGVIGYCGSALPVFANENITLRTGFQLAADRHEVDGGKIRIFSGDGVTEMSLDLVARVDQVEALPVESPAPKAEPLPVMPVPDVKSVPVELTAAQLAEAVALKYSLPSAFVAGVMRTESGFNAKAVSPKGAIGLMQLMPDTARDLGVDASKPSENADGGARYLRDLLSRYEDSPNQVVLALAAYNAGPAAVDKYHGVPPYRETREYILRVLKAWNPPAPAK